MTTKPIRTRADEIRTFKSYQEFEEMAVLLLGPHTDRQVLEKVFSILEGRNAYKYRWLAITACEALDQVVVDRGLV